MSDMGHLPFSHAAEKELLPEGWDHERLSREIIESPEMAAIWSSMVPPLLSEHIVKIALGPGKAKDLKFTPWERVVADMLVGDAFGADRIDYLLRDSHHAGVAYGKFDHYRLIDCLRILPSTQPDPLSTGKGGEPALGIQEGGLQSAEAMALARHFMYSQVYFHVVRRIYDVHLKEFLQEWLPNGRFSTSLVDHFAMSDNEVNAAMLVSSEKADQKGHISARHIMRHTHFKRVYSRRPTDTKVHPEPGTVIFRTLREKFGKEHFRHDSYVSKKPELEYPVRLKDGTVVPALNMSATLVQLPSLIVDVVYASREKFSDVSKFLSKHQTSLLDEKPGV